MSELVPNHETAIEPASSKELAGPLDILRIQPELVKIAEDRDVSKDRLHKLLAYLLRLTNGQAIAFYDFTEGAPRQRECILGESVADMGGMMSPPMESAAASCSGKRATVIQPLPAPDEHFVIAVPLIHSGKLRGAVCLVLVARDINELQPFVVILQTALGFLHYALLREEAAEGIYAIEQTSALVELTTQAAAAPYFEESVRILADELRRHMACYRVGIGVCSRNRVHLQALSGTAQFDPRGTAAHVIESAMRESILRGGPVRWPSADSDDAATDLSDVAHQELLRLLDLGEVMSVPLTRGSGEAVAVMTFMWTKDDPPGEHNHRFIEAATPHLGAVVSALRQADPGNARKWWHHLWSGLTKRKRAILLGISGALVLLLAWPMPFPVRVDCHIEPVLRRVISSPFEGILKTTMVEPGQEVRRGDLLALMDDKELVWKHAELLAARDRALRQRDLAMTDSDSAVALAQMAQLEADGHELEIKLIEHRKANLELRAPIDGMILAGDLRRAEGMPIRQGQVLFEIGPSERMIVELRIPASDISLVREGAPVRVRLASFPGETWRAVIRSIHPQSTVIDNRNVFIAEASLMQNEQAEALRSGMKGRASISGGHAPLAWILTRRLWDFIHQTLFW